MKTCCYDCEHRTIEPFNCHEVCEKYAKLQRQRENERNNRRAWNELKFDISLNRVCEEKLRRG